MEYDEKLTLTAPRGCTFSKELVNAIVEIGELSKEERNEIIADINELKGALKTEFAELKIKLSEIVKEEINALDDKLNNDLAEVENTKITSLASAEEKFNNLGVNRDPKDVEEYKNSIKGIKFVAKRSKIKANNDHEMAVRDTKMLIEDLYVDYGLLAKTLNGGKVPFGLDLNKNIAVFLATFSFKKFITNKQMWINSIPFFMLMILIAAYFIAKSITGYGGDLTNVINNGVFIAVVATGAVFIYSGGSFDMSLGPASLMCATLTAMTWNATANIFVALLVGLLVGAMLGIVNAVLANVLNLPVMVMTLTMMNILNAIHAVILERVGGEMKVNPGMITDSTTGGIPVATIVYATCLFTFFLLLWAIFNYTKIGRRNKFIGSNATAAKFNGISLMKSGIISFAISGIGLGLCGFLFSMSKSLSGSPYSGGTILDTIGLNVVIAIVFGGMTTSGGPRSRVSCAIIGAFFCIFLDELFRAIGIADYRFMAKGIIFLAVSFANMYSSRTKMLAR